MKRRINEMRICFQHQSIGRFMLMLIQYIPLSAGVFWVLFVCWTRQVSFGCWEAMNQCYLPTEDRLAKNFKGISMSLWQFLDIKYLGRDHSTEFYGTVGVEDPLQAPKSQQQTSTIPWQHPTQQIHKSDRTIVIWQNLIHLIFPVESSLRDKIFLVVVLIVVIPPKGTFLDCSEFFSLGFPTRLHKE